METHDDTYMESTFTALATLGAWDDPRPSLGELYDRCAAWLRQNGMTAAPLDAFARLLRRISHPAVESVLMAA